MISGQPKASCVAIASGVLMLTNAAYAQPAQTEILEDGTHCTIAEARGAGAPSTTVTAGGGRVTSSTTMGTGAVSSSSGTASSNVSSGNGSAQSMSTTSFTRPDGSAVTRSSDGHCVITKPAH